YGAEEKDYNYLTFTRQTGNWRTTATLDPPCPRWSWPPSDAIHAITSLETKYTGPDKSRAKAEPPPTVYSETLVALQALFP
ncbi:MAG: hypothetical protein GY953_18680, partial [bacterium]|nr:hypothetical protein [bacterium]